MTVDPGLCARCTHARVVPGARSQFWMCGAAGTDDRLRRYPALPVTICHAFTADNHREPSHNTGR